METNELRQIRIDKLDKLDSMGVDPYSSKYYTEDLSVFLEKYSDLSKKSY